MPNEIFLSHSSENGDVASSISETIRNHGVPVWFSPTNVLPSQHWHDEIGKALKRCDWFMILLSNASVGSEWVQRELLYALTHNQYYDSIMPVLIEECDYEELSWTLGGFQIIDFTINREDAYTQILRTWGLGFDIDRMG